jgi:putative ABC transport system ATP-binding protein
MSDRVTVTNLSKSYRSAEGDLPVLRGVSLSLKPGETLALTGESGSGKSTLLHLIAGLDGADGGEIRHDGQDILALKDSARAAFRRDQVGLVFQQFNLIPSLTVQQNISFQARLSGRLDAEFATGLAERLGLSRFLDRFPEQLSGGQQQRVAIARALAGRPPLILADEPTGNLDEDTGDAVINLLLELVTETGASLMMVTHSSRLAARLSRRLHLSHGQLADAARA